MFHLFIDMTNSNKHLDKIYPYDVTLIKKDQEGFGFVVISSLNKGPAIGKYYFFIYNIYLIINGLYLYCRPDY